MKKIRIVNNKQPIEIKLFLSFLNVETERSRKVFGEAAGWAQFKNDKIKLYISCAPVNGVLYLDSLKYGSKLHNDYNDYVNPFYLFDIMNKEGRDFFIEYYKDDIKQILREKHIRVNSLKRNLKESESDVNNFEECLESCSK